MSRASRRGYFGALHSASGVSDRVEYACIDATQIGQENSFDVVAFKSVLGGIGGAGGHSAEEQAIRSMHAALRPGGVLLFAENLSASPVHRFLRRRFVAWGERWRYVTVEEMAAFLASFSSVRVRTFGFAGAFGRTDGQRSSLAAADVSGLDRLVPAQWRYIIAAVATGGGRRTVKVRADDPCRSLLGEPQRQAPVS